MEKLKSSSTSDCLQAIKKSFSLAALADAYGSDEDEIIDNDVTNDNATSNNVSNINVTSNNVTNDNVASSNVTNDNATSDNVTCDNINSNNETNSNELTYRESRECTLNLSSDSESDSDSDSESSSGSTMSFSSSDSSSDNEDEADAECSEETTVKPSPKIKNELDILPPIEELKITVPEVLCEPFGEVAWSVDRLVVIQPKTDKPVLDLDTVLFVDRGKRTLGKIFDVFGQVKDPMYCVRFNSPEHINECGIKPGMAVYFCPNSKYTSLVFVQELMKVKGADDAGEEEHPDFSDDEEERKYYKNLNKKKAEKTVVLNDNKPNPKRRKQIQGPMQQKQPSTSSWQSNHPWNRNQWQPSTNQHVNTPLPPPMPHGWQASPQINWPGMRYMPYTTNMPNTRNNPFGHPPPPPPPLPLYTPHYNNTRPRNMNNEKFNYQ